MRHPNYVPQPPAPWVRARFLIATNPVSWVEGWQHADLGLSLASAIRARYRRKDGTRKVSSRWVVTHLNTGHSVRTFTDVDPGLVFSAATDLASLTDWSFDGFEGWRNTDPDLMDKLQEWHARWGLGARPAGGYRDEDAARAVGMARW